MAGNMQKTKRRFMKESTVMKIHYITGVARAFHCCGTHLDEADNAFFYVS